MQPDWSGITITSSAEDRKQMTNILIIWIYLAVTFLSTYEPEDDE